MQVPAEDSPTRSKRLAEQDSRDSVNLVYYVNKANSLTDCVVLNIYVTPCDVRISHFARVIFGILTQFLLVVRGLTRPAPHPLWQN
jgi:hypothetical protein